MPKYYQTNARKIRMMGPCCWGYNRYVQHFGELPLTLDRETCNDILDKLHWADVAWFTATVRNEHYRIWYKKLIYLKPEQRKKVFYRAVNKSTLNDILMAFGL